MLTSVLRQRRISAKARHIYVVSRVMSTGVGSVMEVMEVSFSWKERSEMSAQMHDTYVRVSSIYCS